MPKLEVALVQLESAIDLISEATSLGGAGMKKLSDTLDTAEHAGYFAFATGARKVADAVVHTVGEDDLDGIAEQVDHGGGRGPRGAGGAVHPRPAQAAA